MRKFTLTNMTCVVCFGDPNLIFVRSPQVVKTKKTRSAVVISFQVVSRRDGCSKVHSRRIWLLLGGCDTPLAAKLVLLRGVYTPQLPKWNCCCVSLWGHLQLYLKGSFPYIPASAHQTCLKGNRKYTPPPPSPLVLHVFRILFRNSCF